MILDRVSASSDSQIYLATVNKKLQNLLNSLVIGRTEYGSEKCCPFYYTNSRLRVKRTDGSH